MHRGEIHQILWICRPWAYLSLLYALETYDNAREKTFEYEGIVQLEESTPTTRHQRERKLRNLTMDLLKNENSAVRAAMLALEREF